MHRIALRRLNMQCNNKNNAITLHVNLKKKRIPLHIFVVRHFL